MRILEHQTLYQNENFYSTFPSVICRDDGELIVAFRRAPDVRAFNMEGFGHMHPNSQLVLIRSHDGGATWSDEPEIIFAHPLGGSQDPCMTLMQDGTIVLSSYAWMLLTDEAHEKFPQQSRRCKRMKWPFASLGGYMLNSKDGGHHWNGPFSPPAMNDLGKHMPGRDVPLLNRGRMCQASNGRLYWAARDTNTPGSLTCMVSDNFGESWQGLGNIFSQVGPCNATETCLIETVKGDLLAFCRTQDFDDHGIVARSKDKGLSWEPWQDTGIIGHPYDAIRLPDGRIYLVYGYRHNPGAGIRARILDPDGTDCESEEIVLRDDAVHDLGYPWSTITAEGKLLTVYYMNHSNGTRTIYGTWMDIG